MYGLSRQQVYVLYAFDFSDIHVQLSWPSAQSRAARNAFARFIDGYCLDPQSIYSRRSNAKVFNGKSVHNKTIAHNYLFFNYLKYRDMATFPLIV